jgi:hypothetical protein
LTAAACVVVVVEDVDDVMVVVVTMVVGDVVMGVETASMHGGGETRWQLMESLKDHKYLLIVLCWFY